MTDTRDSVIAFLTNFNKWRRGDEEIKQPDPKEIGENIDAAIKMLTALQSGAGDGVYVSCSDLRNLLDKNLNAANVALGYAGSIDHIEENGGGDSEDGMEQVAYYLFYGLHSAQRLRETLEAVPKKYGELAFNGEPIDNAQATEGK